MTLTDMQQKKVEENMGLLHQVIHDKVHGYDQWGFYTYDDLFQTGCIGLCKAAATDKGGIFSTYAYRLIWHEICDALIQSTKRSADKVMADVTQTRSWSRMRYRMNFAWISPGYSVWQEKKRPHLQRRVLTQ